MRSTYAVEHPRDTEKPPGTPSGRRLRLGTIQSPVERLFPPSGGVSRGSVRVGGETFLLPSYGFSFGYKRKGVSIAPLTEAQRNIVGHKMRVNAIPCRRYNPSVSFADSSPYTGEPRFALQTPVATFTQWSRERAPFSTATAALKPDFAFLFV